MKNQGHFDLKKELLFGQELYKHISSESTLHDLIPVYFENFPRGSHVSKDQPWPSNNYYGSKGTSSTRPFLDNFQTAQEPVLWEALEGLIINSFAGNTTSILDLMEEVNKSIVLETEMKNHLYSKVLKLIHHPANVVSEIKGYAAEKAQQQLQKRLLSVLLTSEGTNSQDDLAGTYLAHFPQGVLAKFPGSQSVSKTANPSFKSRSNNSPNEIHDFTEVLQLAKIPPVWEAVKNELLLAVGWDPKVALTFVKQCRSANQPETIWDPLSTSLLLLNDKAFQALLWDIAVSLSTPTPITKLAERYMALPAMKTAKARSALTAIYKADRYKRVRLQPLLSIWLKRMEKAVAEMQQERTHANNSTLPNGTAPLDPSLDAFLRSSVTSTTVGRELSNIAARGAGQCSANAVAEGSGTNASVRVTNTSAYARELGILNLKLQAELKRSREVLPQRNEHGPPPSKKPRSHAGEIIAID
ncbi:hypothetical protein QFC21_003702 [Naganishia friedmannii]|uniref:Uncharacterized protein n=1 Tax=Naganishia friedmannii TaxID=89922 RepID=A0ACC2VMY5_9TREE|nr:hypothetical protein QFC21_003702 [Naganishia friedmannii]